MRVTGIHLSDAAISTRYVRVSADVSYRDRPQETETYWFDVPVSLRDIISRSGNAWLVCMLPLACTLGESLVIDAPVDSVLYENAHELMDVWHFWYPTMHRVPVEPGGFSAPLDPPPTKTAQFFSGGVDSLFSTLRHREPDDPIDIDDLVFCTGFDVPISALNVAVRLEAMLAETASHLGKNLVGVATNLRELRFGRLSWDKLSHGPAMVSAGLLLERLYARLLVPATDGYRETGPWGSHALTDHLLSTSSTRVLHDGAAYSRLEKTELVASYPAALEHLHVCWETRSELNCGQCEKCYRTMIALELLGALPQAHSFAHARLDLDRVARIYCPDQRVGSLRLYYSELLARARREGRDDLAAPLKRALRRSAYAKVVLSQTERLGRVPWIGRLGRHVKQMVQASLVK